MRVYLIFCYSVLVLFLEIMRLSYDIYTRTKYCSKYLILVSYVAVHHTIALEVCILLYLYLCSSSTTTVLVLQPRQRQRWRVYAMSNVIWNAFGKKVLAQRDVRGKDKMFQITCPCPLYSSTYDVINFLLRHLAWSRACTLTSYRYHVSRYTRTVFIVLIVGMNWHRKSIIVDAICRIIQQCCTIGARERKKSYDAAKACISTVSWLDHACLLRNSNPRYQRVALGFTEKNKKLKKLKKQPTQETSYRESIHLLQQYYWCTVHTTVLYTAGGHYRVHERPHRGRGGAADKIMCCTLKRGWYWYVRVTQEMSSAKDPCMYYTSKSICCYRLYLYYRSIYSMIGGFKRQRVA